MAELQIFSDEWLWLCSPLVLLSYILYFWFCGQYCCFHIMGSMTSCVFLCGTIRGSCNSQIYCINSNQILLNSALTLLVEQQEGHPI